MLLLLKDSRRKVAKVGAIETQKAEKWELLKLNYATAVDRVAADTGEEIKRVTVTIELKEIKGEVASASSILDASVGDGPIEAITAAISRITDIQGVIFKKLIITNLEQGKESEGQAIVIMEHEGNNYSATGTSKDIIRATTNAILKIFNKIEAKRQTSSAGAVQA